jgi:hypothetical protein
MATRFLRIYGIPAGADVDTTVTQGGSSDTYATNDWGLVPAPINTVPPSVTGSSIVGDFFDIAGDEWDGEVLSFEYRLKLDGVVEVGVDAFPAEVLVGYDGKVPTFGIRAVGPYATSAWVEVVGPAVATAAPTFSVQPTFGASSYTVGGTVSLNLGTAAPGATLSVEVFSLGGATRISELTGSGSTRSWDSTGEPGGLMTFQVRATNSAGFTLSDTIVAFLASASGQFFSPVIPLTAVAGRMEVIDLEAYGTEDSLTINSIDKGRIVRRSDGKYSLDLTDLVDATTVTITYTAAKAGFASIIGVCTVTVGIAQQTEGWGEGRYYYLPLDGSNQVVVEPGQRHRKIYVSAAGITLTQVAAHLGGLPYSIGSISFSGQPAVDSTITLGAPRNETVGGVTTLLPPRVITFVASGATGFQSNIGVNLAATMTNLAAMLNASTDLTLEKATYTAGAAALNIVSDSKGTGGNTYQLAASVASNGTPSGATLAGGVNVTGSYLLSTDVPVGLGGNSGYNYGEDPSVAISAELAKTAWDTLFAVGSLPQSNHLYFRRGDDFTGTTFASAGRAQGESPIHPIFIGAYGSGADPIVSFPEIGGFVGQGCMVVQNIRLADLRKITLINFLMVDGVTTSGELELNGDTGTVVTAIGVTIRRGKFTDMSSSESVNATKPALTWSVKGDRGIAFYWGKFDASLIEDVFVDIAGWAEGYTLDWSKFSPQPPTFYSHCAYLSGTAADDDTKSFLINRDVTVRRSIFARGALTGFQLRPGGNVYDTVFLGNNQGILVGGGGPNKVTPDKVGNYSAVYDNAVVWAGQKTMQNKGMNAGGMVAQGKMMALINNIVCHSGAGNDGITAHGTVTGLPGGGEFAGFKLGVDKGGSAVFENTKVRKWIVDTEDRNLGGLNLTNIDAATLEDFALGFVGSAVDRRGLMAHIRGLTAPWTAGQNILTYYRPLFDVVPPAPGGITTRVFRPDGRTPGIRWDCRFDWVGGCVPQSGDSIDLAGHRVNTFENNTISDLDMDGGELILWGGRTTVTSLSSAGTIKTYNAGQFYMSGYSGSPVITVDCGGGRFRNAGNITQGMNFIASGPGELLFSANAGNVTIPTGRSITVDDSRALVGWDGNNAAAPTLTIGGTVNLRSIMRLPFSGRDVQDRKVTATQPKLPGKNFNIGSVYNGSSGAFVGTLHDLDNTGIPTGFLWFKSWTGVPIPGETLLGDGLNYFKTVGTWPIAIAGAATYLMPKIEKFNSGIYGPNISNPNIAPAVTLQGSSVLNLDITGLAAGSVHNLIVAASITGTFGTVNITGGAGSISYTATQVILTVAP